jgi:hypothetical protein
VEPASHRVARVLNEEDVADRPHIRRHIDSSPGSISRLTQPGCDLIVDLLRPMDFEVMHPLASTGMHDLLEAGRRVVPPERDRQDHLGTPS